MTPTAASASPRAARCRPRSRSTRTRRRSRTRARPRATSPATWSRSSSRPPRRSSRSASTRQRARYVLGLDAAAARPRRQRREGRRPPRDHPDRRRARRLVASRPTSGAIFDLVARRFLAVFHPPARYARTTIVTEVEGERFRTRGKVTLERRLARRLRPRGDATRQRQDEEDEAEGGELPTLEQGQKVRCVAAEVEAKETKPPPRYTEATLLSAMETRRQADRRRRAARGDEGARPRHPGDARRDDRDADPPRVHRARRQGPPADAEGHPGDHDARRAQAHLARADRRLGEASSSDIEHGARRPRRRS